MRTGKSFVQRFNSNESLEVVPMSRKKYEFSYKDGSGYHFIDPVTYEDITFQEEFVGKVKDYLTENLACEVIFTDEKAADIEPPATVTLKIIESAEGVRGDSAKIFHIPWQPLIKSTRSHSSSTPCAIIARRCPT
jgi:elongation factor P